MATDVAPVKTEAAPTTAAPKTDAAPKTETTTATEVKTDAVKTDATAANKTILGGEPTTATTKEGEAQKTGAPEKYTDFTLPEGLKFAPELLGKFSETAKGLGLSQEAAQKIVDLQAQSVKAEMDARLDGFNKQVEGWGKESQKLFGTDFEKQFGLAAKAVERFGDADLKTLLRETGLGNHPAIIKAFNKIGALMSEDQPVDGRRAGGEAKTTAELMFDKMPAKK